MTDGTSVRLRRLMDAWHVMKNFQDFALYKLKLRKGFDAKFRDGSVLKDAERKYGLFLDCCRALSKKGYSITLEPESATMKYKGSEITLKGTSSVYLMGEVFLNEEYRHLLVLDETVVDVGSSLGDTAIYFILNGAKMIYCIEPFPYTFNASKDNLSRNGFLGKVRLINAAIGACDGSVRLEPGASGADQTAKDSGTGRIIKKLSLRSLTGLVPPDSILKMDCEGCEYEAIGGSDNMTLQHFKRMQIECHASAEPIVARLSQAGFETKLVKGEGAAYVIAERKRQS